MWLPHSYLKAVLVLKLLSLCVHPKFFEYDKNNINYLPKFLTVQKSDLLHNVS